MTDDLEKYIEKITLGSSDQFEDVLKILQRIHHFQIVQLSAEIADLKQEIKKLKGEKFVA